MQRRLDFLFDRRGEGTSVPKPRRQYAERIRDTAKPCRVGVMARRGSAPQGSRRGDAVTPERGEPGLKGCRQARSFWDLDVSKCITSTATLRILTNLFRHRKLRDQVLDKNGACGQRHSRKSRINQLFRRVFRKSQESYHEPANVD